MGGSLYDGLDQQALLEDLRLGGGDVFYYTPPDGEAEEKAGNERRIVVFSNRIRSY